MKKMLESGILSTLILFLSVCGTVICYLFVSEFCALIAVCVLISLYGVYLLFAARSELPYLYSGCTEQALPIRKRILVISSIFIILLGIFALTSIIIIYT